MNFELPISDSSDVNPLWWLQFCAHVRVKNNALYASFTTVNTELKKEYGAEFKFSRDKRTGLVGARTLVFADDSMRTAFALRWVHGDDST